MKLLGGILWILGIFGFVLAFISGGLVVNALWVFVAFPIWIIGITIGAWENGKAAGIEEMIK